MKKSWISAFFAGALFAVGLALSGMTQPGKVFAFLDVFGDWDPSLAFVMVGAIGVHLAFLRLLPQRARPIFGERFRLPTRKDIDLGLILGSALFGIGWAIGGFCPGPAFVAAGSFASSTLIFVGAMLAGMGLFSVFARQFPPQGG